VLVDQPRQPFDRQMAVADRQSKFGCNRITLNPAMAFPCYGSVVAKERGYQQGMFPFVQLGRNIDRRFNGGVAGFLGDQYNAFEIHDDPSSAAFRVREKMDVGCKVTLRGRRMYEFLDRLISLALPRVRDFRGISGRSFDGRGNYNIGVKEQIIFPEVDYDKIDVLRGLNISITTSAKNDEESKALLAAFKFPFKN